MIWQVYGRLSLKIMGNRQRLNIQAFGSRFGQRRWELLLRKRRSPNNPCSRRWRDASDGWCFGEWQKFW
jgi:hypothetical protein